LVSDDDDGNEKTLEVALHVPEVQVVQAPQLVPHVPQFALSLSRFASHPSLARPLQSAILPVHESPHAPAVQVAVAPEPTGHTYPQLPQFFGSVAVGTQTPPHGLVPAAQLNTQAPETHVSEVPHA
jgi:hypothetical protein